MIKKIKPVTAVTQIDFFSRLCKAMPTEFFEQQTATTRGVYKHKFTLVCSKGPRPRAGQEVYLFKAATAVSAEAGLAAEKDFFEDIAKVARVGGFDKVARLPELVPHSFLLIKEHLGSYRLYVQN
jgi:hypothetical protein